MSRNTRMMNCTPQDVFDVLADGWSYANWVVGAARIRDVDPEWPAVGSKIHHSVGLWPLLISDSTEVDHVDPPHQLRLKVRLWPTGSGVVRRSVAPRLAPGDEAGPDRPPGPPPGGSSRAAGR